MLGMKPLDWYMLKMYTSPKIDDARNYAMMASNFTGTSIKLDVKKYITERYLTA